jgi:hypothetical protein
MTTPEPKPDLKKVPELTLHPLCEIIPPCTEAEFKELKEDIKRHGLQVPIKTFEARILDGRSRHRACVELEKEGHPVEFKREIFTGGNPVEYVISMNVKRRHLSASQRALIVARLVTSKLGGDRSVKLPTEITQDDAANLAGVSTKTVTDAKKALEDAELAKEVLDGKLTVSKAAKKVRDREEEEKKKNNPNAGGDADPPAFDATVAVDAYYKAEQSLLNALVALSNASGIVHASDCGNKTWEKIGETLASLKPKKAAA